MIKKYLKDLELTKPAQIKALLNLLNPLLQNGSVSNIKTQLNKKYKIAVVANMSAGKSTFINAMFADDILPAYSEATTDCPIYIYSDDNPDNDKAVIDFLDEKKTIELNKEKVKKELKFYAKKDSNNLDNKYKSVKKIHLHWDFHSLQNNENNHLKFIVIDTPGPNNTDEFQDKHRNITKNIILKEADMVLYLFDYGQIDSNLELSKGNIWDLIKQRKEKDKNFEAFFIINKIDMAFEDNRRLSKIKSSKDRNEFYKNLKEFWFYHENKAVDKIKKSAIKYGFSNPKVFTASSEYQKLTRMKEISFDDEDKLDALKNLFKGVFKGDWEKEFIDYLKISWIEDRTKLHLKNIEQNILKNIYCELELVFKNAKNKSRISTLHKKSKFKKKYDKKTSKWITI
jgi:GTPase Era involved in 16S rRNA processing